MYIFTVLCLDEILGKVCVWCFVFFLYCHPSYLFFLINQILLCVFTNFDDHITLFALQLATTPDETATACM